MYKKLETKILSMLLIIVMLFCTMGAALGDNETLGEKRVITENGITYYIQQCQSKYKTKVTITTNKDKDYTVISLNSLNNTVSSTFYDYKGKGFFGTPTYNATQKCIDCSGYESKLTNAVNLQAISYASKTYAKWPGDISYWYAYGSEAKKTYLKIGGDAIYQIRTDLLNTTKDAKCDLYAAEIKLFNADYNMAVGADVGCLIGSVAGIVAVSMAFPPATVIVIVGLVVTVAAAVVTYAILAYGHYQNIRDLYTTIRTYGTKLS